jgi:hypothetical protein
LFDYPYPAVLEKYLAPEEDLQWQLRSLHTEIIFYAS